MNFSNYLSRLISLLSLMLGLTPPNLLAQAVAPTDAALSRLIEELTDRRTDGLVPAKLPDGTISLDLRGRFQQVALGQFIGGDLPMMHCVNSVEEANVFFGRDLRTGAPLPPEASAEHEALLEEALRHGMSVSEYQFYFELIEQSLAAPQLSAGSTITIVNNDGPDEGFNSTEPQFLPAPGNDTNSNLGGNLGRIPRQQCRHPGPGTVRSADSVLRIRGCAGLGGYDRDLQGLHERRVSRHLVPRRTG
jgi:hypothetical protein